MSDQKTRSIIEELAASLDIPIRLMRKPRHGIKTLEISSAVRRRSARLWSSYLSSGFFPVWLRLCALSMASVNMTLI